MYNTIRDTDAIIYLSFILSLTNTDGDGFVSILVVLKY